MIKTSSLQRGDIEFLVLLIFYEKKFLPWAVLGNILYSKNVGVCYSEIRCDNILGKIYLIILATCFKNDKLLVSVYTKS